MTNDTLPTSPVAPPVRRGRRTIEPPIAVQLARQVLAEHQQNPAAHAASDGWVRLDRKVSRSIVSRKAREFAATYGVEYRVSLDHADRTDPTSPRYCHLFCRVTPTGDAA